MRKSHTEVQSYGMRQFTLMGMESSKSLELEQGKFRLTRQPTRGPAMDKNSVKPPYRITQANSVLTLGV
jgi:hypothetical protein